MNKLTNTLVFFFWALAFVCVGLMFWGILESEFLDSAVTGE